MKVTCPQCGETEELEAVYDPLPPGRKLSDLGDIVSDYWQWVADTRQQFFRRHNCKGEENNGCSA